MRRITTCRGITVCVPATRLTLMLLRRLGACASAQNAFYTVYGEKGCEITLPEIKKWLQHRTRVDINWLVSTLIYASDKQTQRAFVEHVTHSTHAKIYRVVDDIAANYTLKRLTACLKEVLAAYLKDRAFREVRQEYEMGLTAAARQYNERWCEDHA